LYLCTRIKPHKRQGLKTHPAPHRTARRKGILWLLLWSAFGLGACNNTTSLGEDLLPYPNLNYFDTVAFTLKTTYIDTLRTDNLAITRLNLVGKLQDPQMGTITATAYTQLELLGSNLNFGVADSLTLDSLVLILTTSNYAGTPNVPFTAQVHELTEDLSTSEKYTINTTSLTDPNNLADGVVFTPKTDKAQLLRIKLSNDYGNRLLKADPAVLVNNQTFKPVFKGLSIGLTPQNPADKGAVFTVNLLSSTTVLRLYYKQRDNGTVKSLSYDFIITQTCAAYHNVTRSETSGTLYGDHQASPATSPYVFVQSGNFLQLNGFIPNQPQLKGLAIAKVLLQLPVDSNYTYEPYTPPSQLFLFTALEDSLTPDVNGATYNGPYIASRGVYEIDITSYFQMLAFDNPDDNYGFVIVGPSVVSSVSRAVLNGPNHPFKKPRILVFYSNLP